MEPDDLLVRALRVLEVLAGMQQPATLPAVVERARLPRGQVYRALRALQAGGYVDHTARRGYRVATRSLSLGALLGSHPDLRELARPVLTGLAAQTRTLAAFHLRSHHDRVLVLAAAPPRWAHVTSTPRTTGERSPLTRGCAGRAILARLPAPVVDAVLAEDADQDPGALRADLARVAELGVALSFADNHEGHHGISAPVLDPGDGTALGSITLSGDADHFDERALLDLGDVLRAACDRMAPRLATILGPHASSHRPPLDVG